MLKRKTTAQWRDGGQHGRLGSHLTDKTAGPQVILSLNNLHYKSITLGENKVEHTPTDSLPHFGHIQ